MYQRAEIAGIRERKENTQLSLRDAVAILSIVIAGAFILKMFVVDAIHVPSQSMEGTLLDGDYVLVNKLIYGATTPRRIPFTNTGVPFVRLPGVRSVERGDVIVFELPEPVSSSGSPTYFVKRCVAIAGDELRLWDGDLRVNGVEIGTRTFTGKSASRSQDFGPIRVPRSGDVLELNDAASRIWQDVVVKDGHRISSGHSSEILIDGHSATSYRVEQDYLFVVGDNADHSYDSRHWGLLPEENVLGKAMVVYWSVSPSSTTRWERVGKIVE